MRSTAREQKIGFADRLGSHPYVKVGDGLPYFIIIKFKTSEIGGKMKKVAIIMGSDSDLPVVKKAVDTLKSFGVPYEAHIYSAHRSPEAYREVKQFLADHPDYPPLLRNKILNAAYMLYRANENNQ